jgi:iron complex transport system ATP-binding protein|tara:strand:- start:322 stop:1101 length:780 start_codon:yes stop_codon:yes gene_type:complete
MSIYSEKISLKYNDKSILEDINIEIKKGMILSILGPNGAGKSSLLNILSGDIESNIGNVFYDNTDIKNISIQERAFIRSVMSQNQPIVFDFSVRDIVEMGWLDKGNIKYSNNINNAIIGVLNDCEIAHLEKRKFNTLSGGEQRRVHFARSLIQLWRESGNKDSRYLMLDEPTSNLDLSHQIKLMNMLKKLANDGVGILLILHDLNLAFNFSDYIAIIKNGKLFAYDKPLNIINKNILEDVFELTFNVDIIDNKINVNYI